MNHWEALWNGVSEKDRRDFFISLSVIVLAGVFILYYALPKDNEKSTIVENVNTTATTPLSPIDTLVIDNVTYSKVAPAPVPVPVPENVLPIDTLDANLQNIHSTSLSDSDTKLNVESTLIPAGAAHDSIIDDQQLIDSHSILEDSISKSIDNISSSLDTDSLSDVDAISPTEKDTILTSNKPAIDNSDPVKSDCVILVGSYRDIKNATEMRVNLEKSDYKTFVTSDKVYTNIGIYVSCTPTTLNATLKTVRAKFASDAIILKRK